MEAKYEAGDILTIQVQVRQVIIEKETVSYNVETVAKGMQVSRPIGFIPEASVVNSVES